jgi:1-acyl-sn-glycerol-3-phosphate acyltransferase
MSTGWARTVVALQPWWHVRVEGRENLAARGESVVYVANHRHESDILMLFLLRTRFRWLSKMSVFYVPWLGWSMAAIGYVGVVRGSHESHLRSKQKSLDWLERGTPMLFFPEGTFGDGPQLQFKQGAFRLAQEAGAPIVPIVVEGTNRLFRGRYVLPGNVRIRVLPRVETTGLGAIEIADRTRAVMARALGIA